MTSIPNTIRSPFIRCEACEKICELTVGNGVYEDRTVFKYPNEWHYIIGSISKGAIPLKTLVCSKECELTWVERTKAKELIEL